jgi:hypothetical protein
MTKQRQLPLYVERKSKFTAEESPDDFKKNHQFKLDAHLVM